MKHKMLKKPTRKQKEIIEKAGYRWDNWLVKEADNLTITIVHKKTGTRKVILC